MRYTPSTQKGPLRGHARFLGGLCAIALGGVAGPGAAALDIHTLVSSSALAEIAAGGLVTSVQFDSLKPALLPENEALREVTLSHIDSLRPSFLVESLYVYPKPAGKSKPADAALWPDTEKTAVLNAISALSTLSGIEYYSASRKKTRTFYETSAIIDSPETKNELADPVFSSPPPAFTVLYARQKDLSFGDNVYQYAFTVSKNEIVFTQQNLSAMSYGIFPVLAEKKLISVIGIIDCGDSLLFYTASMARAFSVPGIKKKISASFVNRAESLIKWFSLRADEAYR